MKICPNCGSQIKKDVDRCPNCGFKLVAQASTAKTRAAYRKEFQPKKKNSTVQNMIAWIRKNATIVYLLGVCLLIIMSFSRSLGWISFLALMVWLFIICDRKQTIERYTADQRLTEKLNQLGSNTVNNIQERNQKFRKRHQKFEQEHPQVEEEVKRIKRSSNRHYNYIQLSTILTATISLIVLFSGSGAAVAGSFYQQHMSISKVLLSFGGHLLASGQTAIYSLVIYLIWLLLIIFPIVIIFNIFKNQKKSQAIAFTLSLIETIFLIYVLFKMSISGQANTGIFSSLTSQLLTYAVSIGASTYFLIIASFMTTILSAYNLIKK